MTPIDFDKFIKWEEATMKSSNLKTMLVGRLARGRG